MKNTFFALALLIPAFAAAQIKLDVAARYGEDVIESSVNLDKEPKIVDITHASGIHATVALEKENEDGVELLVNVKLNDRELFNSVVKAAYNEKTQLKCTAENVDAELTIVASPVPANQ